MRAQGRDRGAQGRPRVDRDHRDPLPGEQGAPDREDRRARARGARSAASRTSATRATARACAWWWTSRRASRRRSSSTTCTSTRRCRTASASSSWRSCDQRPRVLNLLDACELFVDFRREVVRRRTAFELRKAEARAHVLEGYVIALDHLDEVIALIRAARTPEIAKEGLDLALRAQRDPGRRDPQAAAFAAHRPRAPEDPGRAQGARASGSPTSRTSWPRRARIDGDHRHRAHARSARPTAIRAAPRSWAPPTRSRSRT